MSFYKSDEWREARDAFIEGKVCEWCGHADGDVIEVGGKEIMLHLSPHHRRKRAKGLRAYKMVARRFFKEYSSNPENREEMKCIEEKAQSELTEPIPDSYLDKRIRYIFDNEHRDEIDQRYQEYKEEKEKWYLNMTPENTIVLCNRGHYAREKGLVLCKRCKLHFHKPKYDMCYTCHQGITVKK